MAIKKELCVAGRKYTTNDGQEKTEWINIGRIITKQDGGEFMVLKPYINLSGLPRKGDDVMVSMFDPKENDYSTSSQKRPQSQPHSQSNRNDNSVEDEDIPF